MEKKTKLASSDVMPESFSKKTGVCPICKRNYSEHKYMDYFLLPIHDRAVRNFLFFLKMKLDKTGIDGLKLLTLPEKNILSGKELMELLIAQPDPVKQNQMKQSFNACITSEKIRSETNGISYNLWVIQCHYEGYTGKWRIEFGIHKNFVEKEESPIEKVLEKNPFYKDFLKNHEEDAKIDYHKIQSEINWITNEVLTHEKNVAEYKKELEVT